MLVQYPDGSQGLLKVDAAGRVIISASAVVVPQPTTPVSLVAVNSGTIFTNEGATEKIVFNLPTAVAGAEFTFIVQDADGLRVKAAAGDTIRFEDAVTIAAGYAESVEIGSVVRLVAINDTEWIAASFVGLWTLETS